MKLLMNKRNWLMVLAIAATILCVIGMLIIIGISGTEHLGYMLFNMFLIGGAWFMTVKEALPQLRNG